MAWYATNSTRWNQEKKLASKLLDDFESGVDQDAHVFFTGVFHIYSKHEHIYDSVTLRFVYPTRFPKRLPGPSVYLTSHRDCWQNCVNSHIESDWKLCLFVPGESMIDFRDSDSLNDLFGILHTYLFKQYIYQQRLIQESLTGVPALWPGESRSHGFAGIKEAVQAMGRLGRNDPCLCGSGLKYKRCCMKKIKNYIGNTSRANEGIQ